MQSNAAKAFWSIGRAFSRRTRDLRHGGRIFRLQTLSRLNSWSRLFCSFLGFFLVAAFINQDYDRRSLLLLSGDIESNPGPPRTCGVCGTGIRAGASFLSCVGRSHKQFPFSGLQLSQQERGEWMCSSCRHSNAPATLGHSHNSGASTQT